MERKVRLVNGQLLVGIPHELAHKLRIKEGNWMHFNDQGAALVMRKAAGDGELAFTVGYEGEQNGDFTQKLVRNDIQQLIDIREIPLSRKPGFSKSKLQEQLKSLGINYVHIPELGSPKEVRVEYKGTGDFSKFEQKYRAHVEDHEQQLTILRSLLRTARSAIMCFERDWKACHRGIISKMLEREGFKFVHV